MAAYSMMEPGAVFPQEDGMTELDVMFSITKLKFDDMWRTRTGVTDMRQRMNARCKRLITGWLQNAGLTVPESE